MLHTLWVIGITAEGMTGALRAGREKMDLFGVIMIALVTALGGGSIRDVLIGHYPLSWVREPIYILVVAGAGIITVSIAQLMKYFRPVFLLLDALGLVVFSVLGAQIAREMGLGWIVAVVCAVVTGVAGGMLRDLLCNRVPLVLREELYASISILTALAYLTMMHFGVGEKTAVITSLVGGFILRVLAMQFKLKLPVFSYDDSYYDNRKAMRRMLRSMQRRFKRDNPKPPGRAKDPG